MMYWQSRVFIGALIAICSAALLSGSAIGACRKAETANLADGRAPGGIPWSLSASVESRGSCKHWHFGLEFGSKEFGYSTSDATVPAGGPSTGLQVEASDIRNRAGTEAVFFGYVAADAMEIRATAKAGRRFVIYPRLVPTRVVKDRGWLRRFRYFVFFHSGSTGIERLSVIGAGGDVLETAENQGLFFS